MSGNKIDIISHINNAEINTKKLLEKHIEYVERNSFISLAFIKDQTDNIVKLIGNKPFYNELTNVILKMLDVDNNGTLNKEDIILLKDIFKSGDTIKIVNITTSLLDNILTLIAKFDNHKLKLDEKALEDIVFGTIIYAIFQFAPKDEIESYRAVIEIIINSYMTAKTMNKTYDIMKKITKVMKKSGICKSCCGSVQIDDKLDSSIDTNNRTLANLIKVVKKDQKTLRELETFDDEHEDIEPASILIESDI